MVKNRMNKYLCLQLYLHPASGHYRRLALNCGVVMINENKETHLYYIIFHTGITSNQTEIPTPLVSRWTAIRVRNEAVATSSYL